MDNTSSGPSKAGWFSLAALKRKGRPTDDQTPGVQPRTLPVSALHPPSNQPEPVTSTNGSSSATQAPSQPSTAQAAAQPPAPSSAPAQAGSQGPAGQPEVVKKKRGRPRKHPIAGALSPAAPAPPVETQRQAVPIPSPASDSAPSARAVSSSPPVVDKQASGAPVQSAQPQAHAQTHLPAAAAGGSPPSAPKSPLDHVKALAAAMHTKYAQNSQADKGEATAEHTRTDASHGHARQAATRWDLLNQAAEAQELQGAALHPDTAFASLDRQAAHEVASALNHDDLGQPHNQQQPPSRDIAEQLNGAALSRPGSADLPIEMLLREGQGRKKRPKKAATASKLASQATDRSGAAADADASAVDTAANKVGASKTGARSTEHAAREAAAAAAHSLLHDLSAKKRRGRPPKDPMKLAAALAAYAAPRAAAAAAAAQAASEAADAEIIAQAAAQAGLDVVEQYTKRYTSQHADNSRPDAFPLLPSPAAQPNKKRMMTAATGSASQAFDNAGNVGPVVEAAKPKKKRGRPPKVVMQASMKSADAVGVPSDTRAAPAAQAEATPAAAPAQAALLAAAAAAAAQAEEVLNQGLIAGDLAIATSPPAVDMHPAELHAEALHDSQHVSNAILQAQFLPELLHGEHAAPQQQEPGKSVAALPTAVEGPGTATAPVFDVRPEAAAFASGSEQMQHHGMKPKQPRSQKKQLEVLSSRALTILNSLAHNGINASTASESLATSAGLLPRDPQHPDIPPQSGYTSKFTQWQVGPAAAGQGFRLSDIALPSQDAQPSKEASLPTSVPLLTDITRGSRSSAALLDPAQHHTGASPSSAELPEARSELPVEAQSAQTSSRKRAHSHSGSHQHGQQFSAGIDSPAAAATAAAQAAAAANAAVPSADGALHKQDRGAGQEQQMEIAEPSEQDLQQYQGDGFAGHSPADVMPATSGAPQQPSPKQISTGTLPSSQWRPEASPTHSSARVVKPLEVLEASQPASTEQEAGQQSKASSPQDPPATHSAPQAEEPSQEQQPQQPILAVLSSNLPPIALGTFQGDMQRARIILEAAGFLVPFNVAASMLPADVRGTPHDPPGPAWGGLAEQWAAIQAGQQAEEEEQAREEQLISPNGGLPSPPVASLRGAHKRKQNKTREGSPKPSKMPHKPGPYKGSAKVGKGAKRGRPSNAAKAAAAAAEAANRAAAEAEAAAADLSDSEQLQRPPGGYREAQEGLTQEEWEHMGFQGQLQILQGHELEEGGHEAWGNGSRDMRRSRKPRVRLLEGHTSQEAGQSEADRDGAQDTQGKGRAGRSAIGSAQHKDDRTDREEGNEGRHWPAKRTRSDPPTDLDMDAPVPRRKRSKPTELIRPMDILAASDAAAAVARSAAAVAHEGIDVRYPRPSGSRSHGGYPGGHADGLSFLAAAAAAESESDERARSPAQPTEERPSNDAAIQAQASLNQGAAQDESASHQSHGAAAAPAGSISLRGGEALVGRAVAKHFGTFPEPFRGKVGYYAPRLCPRAPFHVQYEDGDSEDLTMAEVEAILV